MALADSLRKRISQLNRWLKTHCPECPKEQAHLNHGSIEQKYWNYGYMVALRDVLARIERTSRD